MRRLALWGVQPVVAIVGRQARAALGGHYQQEVDLLSLFKDVAHEYIQMAGDPAQIRHLVDRAMRIARAERTVTGIILPNDIQELPAVETSPHKHGTVYLDVGFSEPRVIPRDADLRRAAEILNAGRRVAILVGAGAIGLLGTKPSWDLMSECDALFMVGSSFPCSEFLPKEGQARGAQINLDGRMLSLRYPMEANLTGDSAETLRALLPLLEPKADRSRRDQALAASRPVVLEALTDPNVPTLPPHITFGQAKPYVAALWQGDSEGPGIIRQTPSKSTIETILPRRS